MTNVMTTLHQRGFISQLSDPDLPAKLETPVCLYAGFDPTAQSLHVGNLLQIMMLAQFQRHGHRPLALIGGATAMIGDPSGKSQERNLLDADTIDRNLVGITAQLRKFLDFDSSSNPATLVNNADWIGQFSFVEFLRDVGKHFRVGEMMGKESVRQRLNSTVGMSFTEFSYQLLQSYDFLHLNRQYHCVLQTGGDDQWGNITAGIDFVRKLERRTVYGITSPLLTTAAGQKFGKSESGAVYLDPAMTSPYDFYQYWIRTDDRDVIAQLKLFTFLPPEQIAELEASLAAEPEKRRPQQFLAEQVTELVHGPEQLALVQKASQVLFGSEITGLSDSDLASIFADVPSSTLPRARLTDGIELAEALCITGLCKSRGEVKKLVKAGGVYLNNTRVSDLACNLTDSSLASETTLVLRTGKKKYHLVRFES